MCRWMRFADMAREARSHRDDLSFERAVYELEHLPPHAVRPPENVRRELQLRIATERCTPSAPCESCVARTGGG